ncbi:MAG: SAM-dependent methyltransferase [Flavobacteriales bacterium]
MNQGKLILIPNLLGDSNYKDAINEKIIQTIKETNFFIVENVRTVRRYIKKIVPEKSIDDVTFFSYGKHDNLDLQNDFLQNILNGNDIGLISEAGVPAVADPGSKIIDYAHKFNIKVKPLVGPSSILLAIMSSGMNGQNFAFNGYLPINKKEQIKKIKQLESLSKKTGQTQIFMETPYRNNKLLKILINVCGNNTMLCVASNITLENESIITKSISEWKTMKINIDKQPSIFLIS